MTDSFWCASGDSQRIEFLVVLIHQPFAISAIATQGAVTERSWVSSYLFYGKFDNDPIHLATDDKGNIKVAFITNVPCSYLKLVSQFKEKRALRPVVNIVCSVHSKNEEIIVIHFRHSFSYLSITFIYFTSFIFFHINRQDCLQLTNDKMF